MLLLRHVTSKSFVLIRATDQVSAAREFLHRLSERVNVTHVIVRRADRDGHHLLRKREADEKLAGCPDELTVFEAFDLRGAETAEEVDANVPVSHAPKRCVVLDDEHLVGYYDEHQRDRGPTRGDQPKACALEADFPIEVAVAEVATLLLSLTSNPKTADLLSINLPPGARVDLVVHAGRGFKLDEDGRASLFVPGDERDSPVVEFKLRATQPGRGRIRVLAFHEGQQIGEIKLSPLVVAAPSGDDPQRAAPRRSSGGRYQDSLYRVSVLQPDLSLLILESTTAHGHVLDFLVTALNPKHGLNLARFGPVPLKSEPFQYFRDFFKDIEAVSPGAVGHLVLENRGSYLYEQLVPERLREFLWEHRREIRSVQVQSEEPWIPWELCRLSGREKGRRAAEPKFFCEQFTVTRWLPGVPLRPYLRLGDMALVVPEGSGLKYAQREREAIEGVADGRWQVKTVPANYVDVCDALASGRFSSWHFTGHGNASSTNDPDRSTIALDGGQPLTPADISGVTGDLGDSTPIIFFNACRIAQGGFSLTGPGGWARRLLQAGAGAFISPYWAVYDAPACAFAKSVYENLAGGQDIGEAVRTAREKVAAEGDSTRLAYTVYAHPHASVRLR